MNIKTSVILVAVWVAIQAVVLGAPPAVSQGVITRGPWLFCGDQDGMFHILYRDLPYIHGIGVFSGLNGYTTPQDLEKTGYRRGDDGVSYSGKIRGQPVTFRQTATIEGDRIKVVIQRTGPWPATTWGSVHIALPIAGRAGKTYRADGENHVFPERYDPAAKFPSGIRKLELAPGDPAQNVIFECARGISLEDHRKFNSPNYIVSVPLPREGNGGSVEFFVTLPDAAGPADEAPAALRWSHIGYPLKGEKVVILEWPRNGKRPGDEARVEDRSGRTVMTGRFGPTQTVGWMQNLFAEYTFTDLAVPGDYRVVWSGGKTEFFPVRANVFADRLWQPTLDTFIPFLMCHARVDLGKGVTGHGLCHNDDGERVPPHFRGPDGFVSYECEGTPFRPGEHIPLSLGGWHDAGDFDLNVPAQSFTTWMLALTWEEFKPARDVNSLDAGKRTFTAGVADGVPDILQQVEWGALWLLSVQQADGRVWNGVCEKPGRREGKPLETITDGVPGNADDRQVYVDYHADQQLDHVIAMAAASRVLKSVRPELAQRCLASAKAGFAYFQTHPEVYRPGSYTASAPAKAGERDASVIAAAVELYLTTRDGACLDVIRPLAKSLPELRLDWPSPRQTGVEGFRYAPPFLARLVPVLTDQDGDLRKTALDTCARAAALQAAGMSLRPWPLNEWHFGRWGNSSTALARACDTYWLTRVAGGKLPPGKPLRNMLWIFGLHPVCDTVLVSGLGYPETKYLYNCHLQALNGYAPATVPGAVIPGMGGFWYSGVVTYIDEYGYYSQNEACIYTQAQYLFAVNAMKAMGY